MHQGQQFGPGIGELVQKEIPDNVGLDQELLSIVAMLEIAAAAPSVPEAGRIDARRMGLNDCRRLCIQVLFFVFDDSDACLFVRQDLPDENDSSVILPAETEAAVDDLFDSDRCVIFLQICSFVGFS